MKLILSARREDALRRVAERCGGEVLPLDLASLEDLPQAAVKAKAIYGQERTNSSRAGVPLKIRWSSRLIDGFSRCLEVSGGFLVVKGCFGAYFLGLKGS